MFYRYPLEATEDNWLHDTLGEMLTAVKNALLAEVAMPEWPDIIPVAQRDTLKGLDGLRSRFELFVEKVSALGAAERAAVFNAQLEQNQVPELLAGATSCKRLADLPVSVQEPLNDLFEFAFSKLTTLGIRDPAYKTIYNAMPAKVCPFCGYEEMSHPGMAREALDHYLDKSRYPFAAANLRNLVPMGDKCNSRYKLQQDILKRDDDTDRTAFDPYTLEPVKLEAVMDGFAEGADRRYQPIWHISFDTESDCVTTWDDVFSIRLRLEKDVLSSYGRWLETFSKWSQRLGADGRDALTRLCDFASIFLADDLGEWGFIKSCFFRQLIALCAADERLMKMIEDCASPS